MVGIMLGVLLLFPGGVLASDDGWQHGSLFSAPNWLLDRIDDDAKQSSQMDYYGYQLQQPTEKPPGYEDYLQEAWGYLEGGSYKDAQKSFDKAIELNGTSSEAWYGRGMALENQKRYLSAIDSYEKANSFSKTPALKWGTNAGKGRSYLALQQFENAKNALTTAISQYKDAKISSPDDLALMYKNLAKALEMLGETDAAADALEKAGSTE